MTQTIKQHTKPTRKISIEPTIKPTVTPHTKPTVKITIKPTHLPYPPVISPRVKFMQDTDEYPRVDIPPTDTKNQSEYYTKEPISHRTRARQATPWPRSTPLTNETIPPSHKPVAKRTQSKTAQKGLTQQVNIKPRHAYQRRLPRYFIRNWAMLVMDTVTGETLEHRQLRRHPKYQHSWNESYANKLVRLFQGIGNRSKRPKNQYVEGNETFQIICYEDIPPDRRNKIMYTKVICEYKVKKEDPNRTRITIGGNHICYPGDVGTPTGSLQLFKFVIDSVLYCHNAGFVCFDISSFYLATSMDQPEYLQIRLDDITKEFTAE